ncbi:hypothetical protein BSG1_06954 [Bacillus sp. SG-1]|nr:hypothetical protein BSG1_06954 [Bacillus sp. SG-1]
MKSGETYKKKIVNVRHVYELWIGQKADLFFYGKK